MANEYSTRINPGAVGKVGPYGSFMPHGGMSVQDLVAAAMGQQAYRGAQQQQTADSLSASPGALMGLLRGGAAPGLAQAAVGQQMQAQRGPTMQGSDPFLDIMAANQFQQETDYQVNEALLDYLRSQEPGFLEKVAPFALSGAGMAVGGLGVPGMMAGGGLAGAQMGGGIGAMLAQLLASRY